MSTIFLFSWPSIPLLPMVEDAEEYPVDAIELTERPIDPEDANLGVGGLRGRNLRESDVDDEALRLRRMAAISSDTS